LLQSNKIKNKLFCDILRNSSYRTSFQGFYTHNWKCLEFSTQFGSRCIYLFYVSHSSSKNNNSLCPFCSSYASTKKTSSLFTVWLKSIEYSLIWFCSDKAIYFFRWIVAAYFLFAVAYDLASIIAQWIPFDYLWIRRIKSLLVRNESLKIVKILKQ
jgi:hypothetical protein